MIKKQIRFDCEWAPFLPHGKVAIFNNRTGSALRAPPLHGVEADCDSQPSNETKGILHFYFTLSQADCPFFGGYP